MPKNFGALGAAHYSQFSTLDLALHCLAAWTRLVLILETKKNYAGIQVFKTQQSIARSSAHFWTGALLFKARPLQSLDSFKNCPRIYVVPFWLVYHNPPPKPRQQFKKAWLLCSSFWVIYHDPLLENHNNPEHLHRIHWLSSWE